MFSPISFINEKTCCFTGHRKLPVEELPQIRARLRDIIAYMVREKGVDTFIAGGALGFDTLSAQAVVQARAEDPRLRLVLAIPCRNQDLKWGPKDKAVYQTLLHQADEVLVLSDEYTNTCMRERNCFMVDHSAYCVCYLENRSPRSGTAFTAEYAQGQGREVVNLAGMEPSFYQNALTV